MMIGTQKLECSEYPLPKPPPPQMCVFFILLFPSCWTPQQPCLLSHLATIYSRHSKLQTDGYMCGTSWFSETLWITMEGAYWKLDNCEKLSFLNNSCFENGVDEMHRFWEVKVKSPNHLHRSHRPYIPIVFVIEPETMSLLSQVEVLQSHC